MVLMAVRHLLGSPVPSDGILSEGDKRDSKDDMPELSLHRQHHWRQGARQRRPRSGASISDSAEEDLAHYRVTRARGPCDSLELPFRGERPLSGLNV